jgi:hypothetical protein
MYPIYFSIVSLLLLSVFFVSCNFEVENASPDEITEASLEELLPAAIAQMAHNQSAYSGRSASIFIQNLSGFDASVQPYRNNQIPPSSFDNTWNFGFFSGSLIQAKTIVNMAQEQGQNGYEAIAKIILAHEFAEAASSFGDIPFSQAVQGNAYIFPEYDSQEAVYEGVQNLLDEAILLLEQNPLPISGDMLYDGNMELWKKFAYALKARYLLHTSKRYPDNFVEILDIVHNRTFQSISEQADFYWGSEVGMQNPLYSFATERPHTLIVFEDFANTLATNNDPRLDKMAVVDWTTWHFYDDENPNQMVWARQDASIPFISFAEVKFMEAEALLKTGGTTADITEALRTAIEASFLQMELDPEDHTAFIASHADISGLDEAGILNRIITEAYVAYFGNASKQSWSNYRRLKIPELIPETNPSEYNPSNIIVERFLYPHTERIYNTANTQAAIDRQNGALLDVPLWAFE